MIHDMKPYPAYKDSGVPWLGQVPEHWKTARCGSLFREIVDTGHPELELLSIDRFKGIIRQSETGRKERASEDRSLYKRVRPGEFAYNLMNAFMGSIGFSKLDGIISPAYAVGRPLQEIKTAYFHYLFRTQLFTGQFDCYSYGIMYERNRLYFDRFKQIYTYIPPLSDQSAIVRYLDYMDRRIRRYIHAKQKLIKLLEEQKQAIIHRAVTHGLDPNVKLKPSGVEWLGDVPEHWEVLLNQRIFKEKIRPHGGQAETQLSLSQRAGLIATSDMQERSMQTSTYDNWKVTIPGDLVLNRFKAHLGVFFSSTIRGIVSFHYGVFEPRRPLITKYFELLYHTNVYKTIYAGRSNGMTVGLQNLSNQNFYNVRSIVPPIEEQKKIVSFVEMVTNRINAAISTTRKEMTLYSEYRTRLIADVVTGKLDVREAAASLPDEVEEPEVLEDEVGEGEGLDGEQATEFEEEDST